MATKRPDDEPPRFNSHMHTKTVVKKGANLEPVREYKPTFDSSVSMSDVYIFKSHKEQTQHEHACEASQIVKDSIPDHPELRYLTDKNGWVITARFFSKKMFASGIYLTSHKSAKGVLRGDRKYMTSAMSIVS